MRRSRLSAIAVVLIVVLLASACFQPPETFSATAERVSPTVAPQSTVAALDTEPAPNAVSTPTPADSAGVDGGADATEASGATPAPQEDAAPTPQPNETLHPLFDTLPSTSRLEGLFGRGTWELDTATLLAPGSTGRSTCQEPDPPFLDGFNAKFQSIDHHQYVLVQLQSGDGSQAWREVIERFPNCPFGVDATTIEVPGADQSVVLTTNGTSPDGYWSVAAANRNEHFLLLIGGGYSPDEATLDADALALLAGEILAGLPDPN